MRSAAVSTSVYSTKARRINTLVPSVSLGPFNSIASYNEFRNTVRKNSNPQSTTHTSPLFSSSSNGSTDNGAVTPNETRNLKHLGQLTLSGLMAFAYMRYQQMAVLASVAYFLVRRVGIEGRKSGMKPVARDTILVGGIFAALQVTQGLLGPVKAVVELLVTAFFSYMFLIIASKQQKA